MISQRAVVTNQGTAVSPPASRMGSRKANWALGFAVAGAIGGWLLILPAICSTVAIVLGVAARREIRARPDLKGATKAKAAILLGASFTLLWLLLGISLLATMSSGHVGAYLGG
jgi:4-hydroxybenzoate polyprenyltransferase